MMNVEETWGRINRLWEPDLAWGQVGKSRPCEPMGNAGSGSARGRLHNGSH